MNLTEFRIFNNITLFVNLFLFSFICRIVKMLLCILFCLFHSHSFLSFGLILIRNMCTVMSMYVQQMTMMMCIYELSTSVSGSSWIHIHMKCFVKCGPLSASACCSLFKMFGIVFDVVIGIFFLLLLLLLLCLFVSVGAFTFLFFVFSRRAYVLHCRYDPYSILHI